MLSYIELKNFKSFSNITFDLRKAYGEPKKIAFVYGENGSGKSNLMSSLLFLLKTFNTLDNQTKMKDISNSAFNSIKDEEFRDNLLKRMIRLNFSTLSNLIDDYKMFDSKDSMLMKFGFRINGADGSYLMEFSEHEITFEELRYQINKREGVIFSLNKNQSILSPTIFFDPSYNKELEENINKYWGKHTFMSILFNEYEIKNDDYINAVLNKNLLNVFNWLKKLSISCKEYRGGSARISIPFEFLVQLDRGSIKSQNNKELKLCEKALNSFFTQLYSDIKDVHYVFTSKEDKFSYELYFKKLIDGKSIDIPISLESTGTQKLLEIFPMLFSSITGASVFIDEIDSDIHDLLMKSLLEQLEDAFEGQLIATTHNTLLMESLPPESIYIIRIDANGGKSIECIANYKERTQKTNNIRNKYLRGDYEGIPYTGNLDFKELVEDLLNNIYSLPAQDGIKK